MKETLVLSGLASALLFIISWPAFKYFFFAEAFTYMRIYTLNGRDLWQAAFSRMDNMFFRPGFFLSDIWWHFVLPPDPIIYHVRNFIFCAINLFIFYRVLLKFVESRRARVVALGIFAASKIHMTIIGYVNVYEASILLMTILLAVLFWFRYIESRRASDYALTLLFCAFSAFSKDNGFIVVVLLCAMVLSLAIKPGELMPQARYWAVRVAPFIIISASYLILRYILTGPLSPDNPVYSPRLSLSIAAQQAAAFLATAGNFSVTDASFMGSSGISGLIVGDSRSAEIALTAALWALILFTLWRSRSRWRLLIVPVVWIGLYLSPTFLIRNHQVYYHQEPLVGLAILTGICLDQARRRIVTTWIVVVALIAINGFISNRRSYYTWQYCANRAESVVKPIISSHKQNPPKVIVFVSPPASHGFWRFAVGGPFVSHLLGSPDTAIHIVSTDSFTIPDSQVYYLPD